MVKKLKEVKKPKSEKQKARDKKLGDRSREIIQIAKKIKQDDSTMKWKDCIKAAWKKEKK